MTHKEMCFTLKGLLDLSKLYKQNFRELMWG